MPKNANKLQIIINYLILVIKLKWVGNLYTSIARTARTFLHLCIIVILAYLDSWRGTVDNRGIIQCLLFPYNDNDK